MENEIENIPQIKKTAAKLGFGNILNEGIDLTIANGKKEYLPIVSRAQDAGETDYQPKITIGDTRAFFNGYVATLYGGLHMDQEVNGVNIRALTERMTTPTDKNGMIEDPADNLSGAIKAFNDHIRADLLLVRDADEDLFKAITARYGPHGLDVDQKTMSEIITYGIQHTQTRWFSADEKITIDEAARMLVKSDTPGAVRKELLEYRKVDDVLQDFEQAALGSAEHMKKQWLASEKAAQAKVPKGQEREFNSKLQTMRRFANFMKPHLKGDAAKAIDLMEKVPTWLSIDFNAKFKTYSDNLPLNRVPDRENFLPDKYSDFIWTEGMSNKEYWQDIRDLESGKTLVITPDVPGQDEIEVSVNPSFRTIHIRNTATGELQGHEQFRTQEAKQRIAEMKSSREQQPGPAMRINHEPTPQREAEKKSPAVTPTGSKRTTPASKRGTNSSKATTPKKRAPASNKKGPKRTR